MEGGGRDGDITRDTKRRCRVNSIWPKKVFCRNRYLDRMGDEFWVFVIGFVAPLGRCTVKKGKVGTATDAQD